MVENLQDSSTVEAFASDDKALDAAENGAVVSIKFGAQLLTDFFFALYFLPPYYCCGAILFFPLLLESNDCSIEIIGHFFLS